MKLHSMSAVCTMVVVLAVAMSGVSGREPGEGGKFAGSTWVSVGPGGGGFQHFPSISPFDTQLYFVACDMGGFYRSTDRGLTWRMNPEIDHVTSPAIFHPTDSDVVYVFQTYGQEFEHGWRLWRSNDKGATWKPLHEYIGPYNTNYGTCLAIDPARPMWLMAGMGGSLPGKILLSTNGGKFFTQVDKDIPKEADVINLVMDLKTKPGMRTIYAATTQGMYASTDDGKTWGLMPSQPGDGKMTHFSACQNPQTGDTVFFAVTPITMNDGKATGGLFKSGDFGKTWEQLTDKVLAGAQGKPTKPRFRSPAVNYAKPEIVYLAVDGEGIDRDGAYKSVDGGLHGSTCCPAMRTTNLSMGRSAVKAVKLKRGG